MRVLIIENDEILKTVYESELHQQNITVDLASDGVEGLKLAKEHQPDLILMELILPKMNGFDFLKKVKKDKKLKKTKIIVSSLLSQKNDITEAKSFGIDKYLQKNIYSQKQVTNEVLEVLMSA